MFFLILVFGGVAAGTIAGLFGLGGGVLFTPILFMIFSSSDLQDPAAWAIGTSLFCTFSASLSSSIQQRKNRNLFWREGLLVGIFGSVGVYAGKEVVTSQYYTETIFVLLFSLLLVVVAFLFFHKNRQKTSVQNLFGQLRVRTAGSSGVLGGFVAAIAGVGGGVVLVPLMNLVYKINMAKAISISSLAIVFISMSGWVQYAFFAGKTQGITQFTVGLVDFGTGLPLITGAIIGGLVGVRVNHKLPPNVIRSGFAILILILASVMMSNIL
jgi:uncharacterized membrane protein YfcA